MQSMEDIEVVSPSTFVHCESSKKIGSNDGDGEGEGSPIEVTSHLASQHSCKEPLLVRSKGCGKRMMGGKEKAVKKARHCNGCGKAARDNVEMKMKMKN